MRGHSSYTRIFFTGWLISFLGALPLGTLNVLAARMAVNDGVGPAIWFSVGTLISEMVYVRLSLVAMGWIRRQKRWLRVMEGVTLAVILLLAIGSFWEAAHPYQRKSVIMSFISPAPIPRLLTGMLLSAINPLQIPFWFGWSTLLLSKKILLPRNDYYNSYIAGIGLGTFVGNSLFIFGGRLLVEVLNMHQTLFNGMIGLLFTITAGWQLRKLFRRRPTYHDHQG